MDGAEGLALTELEGLREELGDKLALGEPEALDDGLVDAEGLRERLELALGDRDDDGDVDALGDRDKLALEDALELGDRLDDGDIEVLALGLLEDDAELLTLDDGDRELEGDRDALGERDTPKLCIEISQLVLERPLTTLNSSIAPKTLPRG